MASSEEARAAARIGTVLKDKYRLDRVLGEGGMATVYAATHRNGHECAVKVLHPELALRDDVWRRFLREAYIANKVKHPGVVRVQDDDVCEDGAAFLVMELLDGIPVEALAAGGAPIGVDVAVAVVDQLLDVLAAAHASGVVHRDIKPANLFLTREGVVKVLDFGIAQARDAAQAGAPKTQTGAILGTPAFMAPEQVLGKSSEIDGRTDLWAVGATFFTMLTGRAVHQGENAPQILVLAATKPAPPIAVLAPQVPDGVATVFDRALAFDKAQRWPDAAAMQSALREAWRRTTGSAPTRAALAACFDPAARVSADPMSLAPTAASSAVATAPLTARPVTPAPSPTSPMSTPQRFSPPTSPMPTAPTVPRGVPARTLDDPALLAGTVAKTLDAPPPTTELVLPVLPRSSSRAERSSERASRSRGAPQISATPWNAILIVAGVVVAFGVGYGLLTHGEHGASRRSAEGAGETTMSAPAIPSAQNARHPQAEDARSMVSLAGGVFTMGPSPGAGAAGRTKSVEVAPFLMDKTEVTVAGWEDCARAHGCPEAPREVYYPRDPPRHPDRYSRLCTGRDPGALRAHPINCVTAREAEAYCEWAGKRLPTEAEWEFAARAANGGGVSTRPYPWDSGEPSPTRVNACGPECVAYIRKNELIEPDQKDQPKALYETEDGYAATAPVGTFAEGATETGLLDMAGNVEEWTADTFAEYGQQPDKAGERVTRGGNFLDWHAVALRATSRDGSPPDERDALRGFRCARDARP